MQDSACEQQKVESEGELGVDVGVRVRNSLLEDRIGVKRKRELGDEGPAPLGVEDAKASGLEPPTVPPCEGGPPPRKKEASSLHKRIEEKRKDILARAEKAPRLKAMLDSQWGSKIRDGTVMDLLRDMNERIGSMGRFLLKIGENKLVVEGLVNKIPEVTWLELMDRNEDSAKLKADFVAIMQLVSEGMQELLKDGSQG